MATVAPGSRMFSPKGDGSVPDFMRGFVAMLPLWAGAIPFGIAFGVAARNAGLSGFETSLMSLTIISAGTQVSVVSLWQAGASSAEIIATAIALNIHIPLIGTAIAAELRMRALSRMSVGWLLTDGTYSIAAAQGRLSTPLLLGCGLSMYAGWNIGTLLGIALGANLAHPERFAVELVIPLTFIAVLTSMLKSRAAFFVAGSAAVSVVALGYVFPLGVAILVTGIMCGMLGAWVESVEGRKNPEESER